MTHLQSKTIKYLYPCTLYCRFEQKSYKAILHHNNELLNAPIYYTNIFSGGGWGWMRSRLTMSMDLPSDLHTSVHFKKRLLRYQDSKGDSSVMIIPCQECHQMSYRDHQNFHKHTCSKSPYCNNH